MRGYVVESAHKKRQSKIKRFDLLQLRRERSLAEHLHAAFTKCGHVQIEHAQVQRGRTGPHPIFCLTAIQMAPRFISRLLLESPRTGAG